TASRSMFTGTTTTQFYTLSLHDALPIWRARPWMYASAAAMVVGGLCALVVRSDVAAAVAVLAAAVASVLLMVGGTMAGHRELARSEEHTSELQSREKLVCRLLLEKKKLT